MTETVTPQPVNGAAQDAVSPEERRRKLAEIIGEKYQELKFEEERFNFQQRRAKLFAASGLFSIKDMDQDQAIAQALVKIELGESMGFTPAEALQGIYVINGATAISSALRASRMQAAGYSWDIEWINTKDGCEGCILWLKRNGVAVQDLAGKRVFESFTKADALKMLTTLWDNGQKRRASILEKDNWKMAPRNMYFARAVTNLQRFYAPHVLSINILSAEEAEDLDTEAGRTETDADRIAAATAETSRKLRERFPNAPAISPSNIEQLRAKASAENEAAPKLSSDQVLDIQTQIKDNGWPIKEVQDIIWTFSAHKTNILSECPATTYKALMATFGAKYKRKGKVSEEEAAALGVGPEDAALSTIHAGDKAGK